MQPYLSLVAASRNDDHGGDPLIRTQIFINTFAHQCEKYRLPAELIIVDWNPVPDRPGLATVLHLPAESTYAQARTITVPTQLHRRLKYSEQLPFFQMIAKNVGIRRAKGKFVLATNIDVLFSDELIRFIARQRLDPKKQYRVDRYDIESGLSQQASLEETLDYAWSHPIRANRRYQPEVLVRHLYGNELFKKHCVPEQEFIGEHEGVELVQEDGIWRICAQRSANITHLHTNACGDFTLMSCEGWFAVRGYPEFEAYSFNIDSMGFVAAHYAGYQEVSLLPPCVCFHIEHGIGSGWTPEGEKHLWDRLEKAGILNPEWPVLTPLVDEMRKEQRTLEFNNANWGLADVELPERTLGNSTPIAETELERLTKLAETHPVSAIQPAYDLDRLTLAHERMGEMERVVFYIPDSQGSYSETSTIAYRVHPRLTTSLIFRFDEFPHRFPLRFDPCQCPGLISISSVTVFDVTRGRMIWEFPGREINQFAVGGTAVFVNGVQTRPRGLKKLLSSLHEQTDKRALSLLSTGLDPQLIFPPLPENVEFPLEIAVEFNIIPSHSVPD